MPAKTQGEKIDELKEIAAKLTENQKTAAKEIEQIAAEFRELSERVVALEKNAALVDHKVNELWQGKKDFVSRLWMIAGPIVAAILRFMLRGCLPAN